nr:hypothetical protein [Corynebacterium amycolatum]
VSNVLIGALIATAAGVFGVRIWLQITIGLIFALISAGIAALISPRSSNQQSVTILLNYAPFIARAMHLMPRVAAERSERNQSRPTLSD